MRSGRKMSPVSTHQGRRSSVEKEGVWAQNKMSRQWGLCRGREWDGEPSLPALGCWPVPLQPHQHDKLQRAGAITLIYTVPSSSARQVERAPLQSHTGAHNILSSQKGRSSPTHSMHLPRADRGGKSILTGLRCGYHCWKALQPHSPFLSSLSSDSQRYWRVLPEQSLSGEELKARPRRIFPGKISPSCCPKAIWSSLRGPFRAHSQ